MYLQLAVVCRSMNFKESEGLKFVKVSAIIGVKVSAIIGKG